MLLIIVIFSLRFIGFAAREMKINKYGFGFFELITCQYSLIKSYIIELYLKIDIFQKPITK